MTIDGELEDSRPGHTERRADTTSGLLNPKSSR